MHFPALRPLRKSMEVPANTRLPKTCGFPLASAVRVLLEYVGDLYPSSLSSYRIYKMPLPLDPRGNSITTSTAESQSQSQTPHATAEGAPLPGAHTPIPFIPAPALTEDDARELAHLKAVLHAHASPDGFAPSRVKFDLLLGRSSRPYFKFFRGYDEFIRSCGYRSALERLRENQALRRASRWAAAWGPVGSSPTETGTQPINQTDAGDHAGVQPNLRAIAPSMVPLRRVRPKTRNNEMFYGDPIHCCDMAHAPVNEQGVVLLFGMLAKKLGFRIEMVRTGFPDCEAKRKGDDDKWRRVRIEFEFLSSRFNHDPAGCDLIVCWEDDANPTRLPVLALKNHVGQEEPAELAETKPPAAKAGRVRANRAAPIRNQSRLDQPARKNQNHKEHNRKTPNRQKPGRQKQGRQKQSPRKQERKSSRRHSTRRASAPK